MSEWNFEIEAAFQRGLAKGMEEAEAEKQVIIDFDCSLIENLRKEKEARIRELEEALRPFVETAIHDIGNDEADGDFFRPMMAHNRAPRLTVGHFRSARAALRAEPVAGGGRRPDMSTDVIKVMARALNSAWGGTLISKLEAKHLADLVASALASAGYRLAGPGECVVQAEAIRAVVRLVLDEVFKGCVWKPPAGPDAGGYNDAMNDVRRRILSLIPPGETHD